MNHLRWLISLMTVVALFTVSCGTMDGSAPVESPTSSTEPGAPDEKLDVVTTIYPVTYFTERIGGDRVSVTPVVKPGVDAHDFEPKPSDVGLIANADLLVYNHPAFETWVSDALEAVGGVTAIQTADAEVVHDSSDDEEESENHDHDDAGADPHVWLNPLEAIEQVRRIQQGLIEADPASAGAYEANADALAADLAALDQQLSTALSSCEHDEMVVSHLAYGHLAERYGLHQIGLSGLYAEFESGPQQIAAIVERMHDLGIEHILQEPISSSRLAETVATETGAEVLPLHPLETLTQDEIAAGEDYFSIMQSNISSLTKALNCSPATSP